MTKSTYELQHRAVLESLRERGSMATYVIRNTVAMREGEKTAKWPGATTSTVLRACRRLERQGLVEQVSTSYRVMLSWRITPGGRHVLNDIEVTEATHG